MTLLISEKRFIVWGVLHKVPTSIECNNRQFHYYFDTYNLVVCVVAMNTSFTDSLVDYMCNELGKYRPRHWGKAGLGDRFDRRRLISLLKEQTQSGDDI